MCGACRQGAGRPPGSRSRRSRRWAVVVGLSRRRWRDCGNQASGPESPQIDAGRNVPMEVSKRRSVAECCGVLRSVAECCGKTVVAGLLPVAARRRSVAGGDAAGLLPAVLAVARRRFRLLERRGRLPRQDDLVGLENKPPADHPVRRLTARRSDGVTGNDLGA